MGDPTLLRLFMMVPGPLRIWDLTTHAGPQPSRVAWKRYPRTPWQIFLILSHMWNLLQPHSHQWHWPLYHLRHFPPIQPNVLLCSALIPIGKCHCLKGTDQEAHKFHPSREWPLLPHHCHTHSARQPCPAGVTSYIPQSKQILFFCPWGRPQTYFLMLALWLANSQIRFWYHLLTRVNF